MKRVFGLIGFPLGHSFSRKYFTEKFEKNEITDCEYKLFELESIRELPDLLQKEPDLNGFNITIPYKQEVFQYLDELDEHAKEIGAVNVVKINDGKLKGYNSDYLGFTDSLLGFIQQKTALKALILGTGGASKAIAYSLTKLNIPYQYVSRSTSKTAISYEELAANKLIDEYHLIINTTPLGTYPKAENAPNIPYDSLTDKHYLYDLVYNPSETLFMKRGLSKGASVKNGYDMLVGQAEASWHIWNES